MLMLEDNGLLRERGRIAAVENVRYDVCHPIIVPRKHHVSELLVFRYHQLYRYVNAEIVVYEIRQLHNIP